MRREKFTCIYKEFKILMLCGFISVQFSCLNEKKNIFEGCRFGVYGISCDQPCPTNCKNKMCHIVKGTCFECKPGWIGILCETSIILNLYFIYL